MEEYKTACCIQGYCEFKVQNMLLAKAYVHDSPTKATRMLKESYAEKALLISKNAELEQPI